MKKLTTLTLTLTLALGGCAARPKQPKLSPSSLNNYVELVGHIGDEYFIGEAQENGDFYYYDCYGSEDCSYADNPMDLVIFDTVEVWENGEIIFNGPWKETK